jgi:hypothetical protein
MATLTSLPPELILEVAWRLPGPDARSLTRAVLSERNARVLFNHLCSDYHWRRHAERDFDLVLNAATTTTEPKPVAATYFAFARTLLAAFHRQLYANDYVISSDRLNEAGALVRAGFLPLDAVAQWYCWGEAERACATLPAESIDELCDTDDMLAEPRARTSLYDCALFFNPDHGAADVCPLPTVFAGGGYPPGDPRQRNALHAMQPLSIDSDLWKRRMQARLPFVRRGHTEGFAAVLLFNAECPIDFSAYADRAYMHVYCQSPLAVALFEQHVVRALQVDADGDHRAIAHAFIVVALGLGSNSTCSAAFDAALICAMRAHPSLATCVLRRLRKLPRLAYISEGRPSAFAVIDTALELCTDAIFSTKPAPPPANPIENSRLHAERCGVHLQLFALSGATDASRSLRWLRRIAQLAESAGQGPSCKPFGCPDDAIRHITIMEHKQLSLLHVINMLSLEQPADIADAVDLFCEALRTHDSRCPKGPACNDAAEQTMQMLKYDNRLSHEQVARLVRARPFVLRRYMPFVYKRLAGIVLHKPAFLDACVALSMGQPASSAAAAALRAEAQRVDVAVRVILSVRGFEEPGKAWGDTLVLHDLLRALACVSRLGSVVGDIETQLHDTLVLLLDEEPGVVRAQQSVISGILPFEYLCRAWSPTEPRFEALARRIVVLSVMEPPENTTIRQTLQLELHRCINRYVRNAGYSVLADEFDATVRSAEPSFDVAALSPLL